MYLKGDQYYEFIGWSSLKKELDICLEYNQSNILNDIVIDAELQREKIFETFMEHAAIYRLQELEKIAIQSDFISDILIRNEPAHLFIFGKFLGGVYVFKKVY